MKHEDVIALDALIFIDGAYTTARFTGITGHSLFQMALLAVKGLGGTLLGFVACDKEGWAATAINPDLPLEEATRVQEELDKMLGK